MEYRALYSGDHLSHGKFKYIDKWKSKAGNWVYKYAEDANEGLKNINDRFGPKVKKTIVAGGQELKKGPAGYDQKRVETTKNLIGGRTVSKSTVYQRSGRPSKPDEWVGSKTNPSKTMWKKLGSSEKDKARAAAGYDQKRISLYNIGREPTGVKVMGVRTEYRDSKYDAMRSREYSVENARSRGNAFMKALGAFNDKYGPKFRQENKFTTSMGHVYVDSYIRNLIGGKKVRVESYTYDKELD